MMGFSFQIVRVHTIFCDARLRFSVPLLRADSPLLVLFFKPIECLLINTALYIGEIHIAECHNDGIARVVVCAVEIEKLLIAEIQYILWLATTVIVICRRWK